MSLHKYVLLREDEHESLYIEEPDVLPKRSITQELVDHGINIPENLVTEHARLSNEWREHQKELREWFETWLPKDPDESDRLRELVLFGERTWSQLAKVGSCDHVDAITLLDDPNRHFASCDLCGSSVNREHKRNDDGKLISTGELKIR